MSRMVPDSEDRDAESEYKPLTADEARQLRQRNPSVSPWRVVVGQVVVGRLVALAAWGLTGRANAGWSAGYGALAVVIPAALFARGLTGRFASLNAGAALAGLMVWEMVKVALTVAMLAAAPRLVMDLSWPAMLIGLVLTMKVYWLALAYAPRRKSKN